MNDALPYIVIIGVFLSVFIPVVLGIFDYARENREMDKKAHSK